MSETVLLVEKVKVAALRPYANNAKAHPPEQVRRIAASVSAYGFNVPVLVDGDMNIISGHGRVMAAEFLGLEAVPVIRIEHLTDEQVRAFRIADNRAAESAWIDDALAREIAELAEASVDLDGIGFNSEEIDKMLFAAAGKAEGNTDPDDVPELHAESTAQRGDVWILGDHRLMCGDSTSAEDVGRLMGEDKCDMIFTDPPYGVSYADKNAFLNSIDKGNSCQTQIKNDHLSVSETGYLWAAAFSVWAKYHQEYSAYYIAAPQGGDLFMMMMMMMMQKNSHPLRHCIIWVKNNHVLGRCDYNYKHEPLLYGWQHKHRFYGNGDQKTSVWAYNKPLKNDLHPTMKPVELVKNAILNSSKPGGVVADYFSGSGTTIIAAEMTGRKCYAMEISPEYVDVGVRRWEAFTGKTAEVER